MVFAARPQRCSKSVPICPSGLLRLIRKFDRMYLKCEVTVAVPLLKSVVFCTIIKELPGYVHMVMKFRLLIAALQRPNRPIELPKSF